MLASILLNAFRDLFILCLKLYSHNRHGPMHGLLYHYPHKSGLAQARPNKIHQYLISGNSSGRIIFGINTRI